MPVTVRPESFTFVEFDAGEIADLGRRLASLAGLPDDADVTIEVDERVPLGTATITSVDPIHLFIEGGALEDPKQPRHLSPAGAADVIGRLLLEVADRRSAEFGAPPLDEELSLAHRSAWDVYCVGRLARNGYRAQRQRRLYAFRTRHGFSDAADRSFERLWSGEGLSWEDLVGMSDAASQPQAT